ncbi:unnamed protein product [Sympodiomycopsis kandeliae]
MRRDVAREIALISGRDTAKDVLNHDQHNNALSRHYTSGPGLLGLAGSRTGEALNPAVDFAAFSFGFTIIAAKAIAAQSDAQPQKKKELDLKRGGAHA